MITRILDPGMTFVDVGANFGWWSEPHALQGMRKTMERNQDLCISVEFAPAWYPNGGAERFLDDIEGYGFKIRKIGPDSQLQALSHDELVRIPHHDLMLMPQDLDL